MTLDEKIAPEIHKAYCEWYKKKHGKEYWTKGNYNLLSEDVKEADKYTARACMKVILKEIEKKKFIDDTYSGFYMVRVCDIRKLLKEGGGK